jgi:hypothetical protein
VGHGLAPEQRAHDVGALAQARVALGLAGPGHAGEVLVQALAAAEGQPEPPREHLAQGRGGLGEDGRVVAVARGRDHAEGQAGRLER